jgi:hypothetical protein
MVHSRIHGSVRYGIGRRSYFTADRPSTLPASDTPLLWTGEFEDLERAQKLRR